MEASKTSPPPEPPRPVEPRQMLELGLLGVMFFPTTSDAGIRTFRSYIFPTTPYAGIMRNSLLKVMECELVIRSQTVMEL